MIAGATSVTRTRVPVVIDSGMYGYDRLKSRSENGRWYGVTKFSPPPTAAMAMMTIQSRT